MISPRRHQGVRAGANAARSKGPKGFTKAFGTEFAFPTGASWPFFQCCRCAVLLRRAHGARSCQGRWPCGAGLWLVAMTNDGSGNGHAMMFDARSARPARKVVIEDISQAARSAFCAMRLRDAIRSPRRRTTRRAFDHDRADTAAHGRPTRRRRFVTTISAASCEDHPSDCRRS